MSYIKELITKINQLKITPIPENSDFKNDVISDYKQWIIDKLNLILKDNPQFNNLENLNDPNTLNKDLVQKLQGFLKENWLLIKGTCLSFTALQNEISFFLYDLVQDIAQSQAQDQECPTPSLLELLMPGITLESLLPSKYPHLNCKSIDELKHLFKSCILSNESQYLIPGNLLLSLNEKATNEPLKNYYFDFENHEAEQVFLNNFEMKKLIHQSLEAEEYYNAVIEYNKILGEEDSLYSRLETLWKHLYYNSKNIAGKETIAGKGIYLPLLNFMEYYQTLSKQIKKEIPPTIKKEIKKLKQVSSQASGFEACLATRQETLRQAIHGNEETLKKIRISEMQQVSALENAKKRMDEARENFQNALNSTNYECIDNLGLTYDLVKKLKIKINLTPKSLFQFLTNLTPEELASFCEDLEIKESIVSAIKNIENFVTLISTGLSDLQLEYFIYGISDELINNENEEALIKNFLDFLAVLIFLNDQQIDIILNELKDNLIDVVPSAYQLGHILYHFEDRKFISICKAFFPHLPQMFKSVSDFKEISEYLTETQAILLYQEWKDFFPQVIPQIIKKSADFKEMLSFLKAPQRIVIFEQCKNQLPALFKSAKDLGHLIKFLNAEQKLEVYNSFKEKIFEVVKSPTDIHHALYFFNNNEHAEIYAPLKKHILSLIQTTNDFHQIVNSTKKFKKEVTLESLLAQLLNNVVENVTPRLIQEDNELEKEILFSNFKEHLGSLIKSAKDFNDTLSHLNPPQRNELYNLTKKDFAQFIKTTEDFSYLLEYLNESQREAVYKEFKSFLTPLIQTSTQFGQVLDLLNAEQCREVCRAVKDDFPKILLSSNDFYELLTPLGPAQRRAVFEELQGYLPKLVLSTRDLCKVLIPLNKEESQILCESLKPKWSEIVESTPQFIRLLAPLKDKRSSICQIFSAHLPFIIKSNDNLCYLIEAFDKDKLWLCKFLGKEYSHCIQTTEELIKVLSLFNPKDWDSVCQNFGLKLDKIIRSPAELSVMLKPLMTQEQYGYACKTLENHLRKIVKTSEDLNFVLGTLSENQKTWVSAEMETRGFQNTKFNNHVPITSFSLFGKQEPNYFIKKSDEQDNSNQSKHSNEKSLG